jgi:hypothetical protein
MTNSRDKPNTAQHRLTLRTDYAFDYVSEMADTNTHPTSVRLPTETLAKLTRLANAESTSQSKVVVRLIDDAPEPQEKK